MSKTQLKNGACVSSNVIAEMGEKRSSLNGIYNKNLQHVRVSCWRNNRDY